MKTLIYYFLLIVTLQAGPYAPAANQEGTRAVERSDERVSHWASRILSYTPGEEVDAMWQSTSEALGEAQGNAFQVVSLGRGGEIVLEFDPPIQDRAGDDFAVFENSFAHTFLEFAFVEVSVDGINFERFTNDSLTQMPVGEFGRVEASDVSGLAGKYLGGFGTPFNLADLNMTTARFVKLIDVIGGVSLDSSGDVIYDPWPTAGSAGFDLDGIAVLNRDLPRKRVEILSAEIQGDDYTLAWRAEIDREYVIETSFDLKQAWTELERRKATEEEEDIKIALSGHSLRFFRVRSVEP